MEQNQSFILVTAKINGQILAEKKFDRFPILFGRSSKSHFPIPGQTHLSGTHGSITFENGFLVVTDLNSTNGILFQGQKLPSYRFQTRGNFAVGPVQFEIQYDHPDLDQDATKTNTRLGGTSPVAKSSQGFTLVYDPDIEKVKPIDMTLQGVVTWGGEVFDVRQFGRGENVVLGKNPTEPLCLPSQVRSLYLGQFVGKRAKIILDKDIHWRLLHKGRYLSFEDCLDKKRLTDLGKKWQLDLRLEDTCSIDLQHDISVHLHYVEPPFPFLKKTLIENREEFYKAISSSLLFHLLICLLAYFSAPKSEHIPVIEHVPNRFAKLLVEPPTQILAPPKIELPPILQPEKPKPVEEKKEIVKKEEKPKPQMKPLNQPKPIVKKEVPKPKKETPVEKVKTAVEIPSQKNIKVADSKNETKATTTTKPEVAAQNQEVDQLMSALSGLNSAPVAGPQEIKIDKKLGAGGKGGLSGTLPKTSVQVKEGGLSGGMEGGAPLLAKAAHGSFATKGLGGSVGQRDVGGAVVGVPKFQSAASPQGLTQQEVMKVVTASMGEIQNCYERSLVQNAGLAGRVEYEWLIEASGVVSTVKVKRSEVNQGDSLNQCVQNVFRKMKFPKSKNGLSTLANIGFPFGKQ